MEITIKDLWGVFKKMFIIMLVFAIICGAAAYIYANKYMQKMYTSSFQCVILPQEKITASQPDAAGMQNTPVEELNNFLVVGGKAIKTLSSLLMAEDTMVLILKNLEDMRELNSSDPLYVTDFDYTADELYKMFRFTMPESDTDLVFTVSCNAYSAHDTYVLLNAFGQIVNQRAAEFWGDETFRVEQCQEPKEGTLVSPHTLRTTVIAAAVGAIIPYMIFLVITMFNSRIKKEDDIKNNFDYPLLGRVPHF